MADRAIRRYITQESHKLEIQARPPIAVTNAVSWRSEGIRYRKNEVFLDVIESLNLLVSSTGNVLRSEILGAVKLKCYLSGMPELRLGLNDKAMFETTGRATRGKAVEMEDVKFHQCVRLSRFENDRTISFIPPDGEFELMSYRLNTQVKPLIWVESDVRSHSGSRIEFTLKARAQFKRRSTANNVEILVPVPEDADTPRFRTNIGSVHYAPEKSAIIWKIKQFGGGKEFLMRAELGLPSVKGDDEHGGGMTGGFGGSMGGAMGQGGKGKRPISVKFEIPYFTTSGIQVRYLKIIEPKVSPCFIVSSLSFSFVPFFSDFGSRVLIRLLLLWFQILCVTDGRRRHCVADLEPSSSAWVRQYASDPFGISICARSSNCRPVWDCTLPSPMLKRVMHFADYCIVSFNTLRFRGSGTLRSLGI